MNIYAFADEYSPNIDEQIKALKENVLQGLEIRNVDGINVADVTKEKAKEVKEKLEKNGLKVFSIGSPVGKIDIEKDDFNLHLQKFEHVLEIAKILEAKYIRVFSFYIPKDKNPDEYTNEVVKRMTLLCEMATKKGITLCHENEKGIFGDNAKRCKVLFDSVLNLKGVFDMANFVQCNEDTLSAWELLKNNIRYLHIKDALADGNIVPAGKGIGNVKKIIEAYKSLGGEDITLEPHLMEFDGLKRLEQAEEKSLVGEITKFSSTKEAFLCGVKSLKELLSKG